MQPAAALPMCPPTVSPDLCISISLLNIIIFLRAGILLDLIELSKEVGLHHLFFFATVFKALDSVEDPCNVEGR